MCEICCGDVVVIVDQRYKRLRIRSHLCRSICFVKKGVIPYRHVCQLSGQSKR